MKTVGEILKKARLEKGVTIDALAQKTRIAIKYLEAIENNAFDKLPPTAFTKGFIQNFAKEVDLNAANVLAIFRRDFDSDDRGRIIPRGLTEPVRSQVNFFNPTNTTLILSIFIGVIMAIFFIRQIVGFVSAPELTITEPAEYAQLTSPIKVVGKTHPQATLTINNRIINLTTDGSFDTQIELPAGEYTLVFIATSRGKKQNTIERVITVVK